MQQQVCHARSGEGVRVCVGGISPRFLLVWCSAPVHSCDSHFCTLDLFRQAGLGNLSWCSIGSTEYWWWCRPVGWWKKSLMDASQMSLCLYIVLVHIMTFTSINVVLQKESNKCCKYYTKLAENWELLKTNKCKDMKNKDFSLICFNTTKVFFCLSLTSPRPM